jgi:hypothetical protein
MGVLRGSDVDEKLQREKGGTISTYISKEGTESGIRRGRGRREAVTTKVKVAGVSMGNIKAKELDACGRCRRTNDGGSGGGKRRQRREGVRQEQQGQWRGQLGSW